MNERDFIYWLNGFLELSGATTLDERQVQEIRNHISLVMQKQTPFIPITITPAVVPDQTPWWELPQVTCETDGGFIYRDQPLYPRTGAIC